MGVPKEENDLFVEEFVKKNKYEEYVRKSFKFYKLTSRTEETQ